MSIAFRPMRPGQEEAVATLVRQLARDIGADTVPAVTGEMFRNWGDAHQVMVAENAGLLCGICTWFYIYSTWRGSKGIYVSDLYVLSHMRGRKLGEGLLRATAKAGAKEGASYIKLEVRRDGLRQQKFYQSLGFAEDTHTNTYFLEQQELKHFITEDKS